MLERYVQVGQHPALGHQRNNRIDVGVGIDIVQAHPHAELAERAREIDETRLVLPAAPAPWRVAQVRSVGTRILGDDQQLLHSRGSEPLGFAQDFVDRPADEPAAHRGNDAEAAAVITPFGDLQVGVVARRQAHTLRRQQIEERIVSRRQVRVHRTHHFLISVGTGHLEHARVTLEDALRPCAQAAGDDDTPVLRERLADRVERLFHRCVDEAAGVDDHDIGRLVGRRDFVAFRAQLREDPLRVHQCLGATETHETDARCTCRGDCGTAATPLQSPSGGCAWTAGHG